MLNIKTPEELLKKNTTSFYTDTKFIREFECFFEKTVLELIEYNFLVDMSNKEHILFKAFAYSSYLNFELRKKGWSIKFNPIKDLDGYYHAVIYPTFTSSVL